MIVMGRAQRRPACSLHAGPPPHGCQQANSLTWMSSRLPALAPTPQLSSTLQLCHCVGVSASKSESFLPTPRMFTEAGKRLSTSSSGLPGPAITSMFTLSGTGILWRDAAVDAAVDWPARRCCRRVGQPERVLLVAGVDRAAIELRCIYSSLK
jgi:hypothetical protein